MTALRTLIEAVEAGHYPDDYGPLDDPIKARHVDSAIDGSIDTALALMEAVLPGWRLDRLRERRVGVWAARLHKRLDGNAYHRKGIDPSVECFSENPGRALLLAILKAMEEQP